MTIVASNSLTLSNVNDGTITHVAYANSADGTNGFTTVYPNLNLLTNSRLQSGNITPFLPVNNAVLTINSNVKGLNVSCSGGAISSQQGIRQGLIPVSAGNQYTISLKIINTGTVEIKDFRLQFGFYDSSGTGLWYLKSFSIPADGKVYNLSFTYTAPANTTGMRYYCLDTATSENVSHTFTIYDMKAELGSTATSWMPSSSEVTTADWPSYIGQYSDFSSTASTDPAKYAPWIVFKGKDGIAGKDGTGIQTTTITYAGSTSGTTAPTSGWTSTIPTVPAGSYLWTKTIWAYTDNTSKIGYSVAKMGDTGPTGPTGSNGDPGTSAINIDLSNKSYNFLANLEVSDSGSVMQAVAGSTTTTFTALQGTAAINITALTCTTTLPTGMTVSIGTLNALSVVVTISVDNTMITPNGGLNFSITAGGVTTTKSFSYSLAINDLTVINLAAINSNLGNVKNIYSNYNGSDGGTYSGTIEINDENIKITATNDNDSNEVSKTQMNGENGIWHSTKLQKINSPGVYVLSNWSLTGTTLSFESQQSDLTYPNGYSYASYGIDMHARNIVGDSISQTTDVPWTTLSPKNGFSGGSIQFSVQNGVEFFSIAGLSVPQMDATQWYQAASLPAGSIAIPSINRVYPISGNNNAWDLLINSAGGVFIRCQAAVSATSNLVNGGCGFPIG
ncbi:hypothetical protein [Lactococcus lactis]|uniref:hypothetical protein n=1 Tax=Lactococcus lactis TaxID=1358 RepID=UPI0021A295DA|nr:hypothetical protein [Lactococcus lactis]